MEVEELKKIKKRYIWDIILVSCIVAFLSSCITYDIYKKKNEIKTRFSLIEIRVFIFRFSNSC